MRRIWETAKFVFVTTLNIGSRTDAEFTAEINHLRIMWGREPID